MPSLTPHAALTIRCNCEDRGDRKRQPVMFSLCVLCVLSGSFLPSVGAQEPQRPVPTAVWAPKPAQPPAYPPGQKPWTKLADLKAAHKGETDWHQVIGDDGRLTGEYVAAAPGAKVTRRL